MYRRYTLLPATQYTRSLTLAVGYWNWRNFCVGLCIEGPGALLSAQFDSYAAKGYSFCAFRTELPRRS